MTDASVSAGTPTDEGEGGEGRDGDAGSGSRWDGGGVRGGWADTRSSSLSRCLAISA
jgi:hypothetical protein